MDNELAAGLRDELITLELQEALESIGDRVRKGSLSDADAIERMSRHMLRLARRLPKPSGKKQVEALAGQVNKVISAFGDDFSGDKIASPPELLEGVLPRARGAETPQLPKAPAIPLATTELLVNGEGQPTLGTLLIQEIECAESIDLISAFVGWTGVSQLRDALRALVERGGQIRVVTSTYLGATSGAALDELVSLGAKVKVRYDGNATKLHAKSWLFHRPSELDTAYIGSSNLSQAALHDGIEWNVRLARADAPAVFARMQGTFESYWNDDSYELYSLADRERLDEDLLRARGSDTKRHSARSQREIDQLTTQLEEMYKELVIRPHPHQRQILENLKLRRESFDEHRHLIVAATGTGKTVIAALDYARMCQPGEPRPSLLFVAHREQILKQSLRTFQQVLGDPSFGELLGGSAGSITHGRHVFAMVQTLSQSGRLSAIDTDAYDVIYIDEAHHGAAESWRRVIEHFAPRELIGLTATPERADGVSVANLFGGAYTSELRLWEAVDDQLLVPFNYIGVNDGTDLRHLGWHSGDYSIGELSELYTGDHARVKIVINAIKQWVEHPASMRALGFCVSKKHAQFMAEQFSKYGFSADFLIGDHAQDHREEVLGKLRNGSLKVVFSVDVLGEGVDVPDVDTLLLLRPTQSPVLFAQQLGRGLRHTPGKTSCTVLDLIGQHRREFRFDHRLGALLDRRRASILDQARNRFPFLPSGCSITLDRVARDEVLKNLEAHVAGSNKNHLVRDLRDGQDDSIEAYLYRTGRELKQLYKSDIVSWTQLRRDAGLPTVAALSTDPTEGNLERDLLRRIKHFQHVTDPLRTNIWLKWLAADEPPREVSLNLGERRLAIQLSHLFLITEDSIDLSLSKLWRFQNVRDELIQVLRINQRALDATPKALLDLADVPLQIHARYTRDEVFAALGDSIISKRKGHREGTAYVPELETQLMFVTLHKDETRYAPSVQYRDHALSRDLFHWESPNNW